MRSHPTLVVNGRSMKASIGDTLVDAAMSGRVVIPHDCCTGQCSTCRVRVYDGLVDDQGTRVGDTVLGCQATIAGDAVIEFDAVPVPGRRAGTVTALRTIAPRIIEVVVTLSRPLTYLPGQYVSLAFGGFPARDYSPTLRLDGSAELNELVFQIRQESSGLVSSQLGHRIRLGHLVKVKGPHGHAFHRKGTGRLVLVATGTGFAPIWSIARAARYLEPEREMVVVVGARQAEDLYMRSSVEWLRGTGVGEVVLACSRGGEGGDVRAGRVTPYLPRLLPTDTVYAAGNPGMVATVELLAAGAGATCYADPFMPSTRRMPVHLSLMQLIRQRFLPVAAPAAPALEVAPGE